MVKCVLKCYFLYSGGDDFVLFGLFDIREY